MNAVETLEAAITKLESLRWDVTGPVPPLVRWHDQEGIPGWDGFIVLGDSAEDGDECNPLGRFYTVEGASAILALARTIDPVLATLRFAISQTRDNGFTYNERDHEVLLARAILGES